LNIDRGVLYIVATPIGNLKDITLRALDVLKDVDVIACEDTRHTLKLLNHYDIKKHLVSVHARNEKEASGKILELLSKGESVAYVSDAGTPSISDPGSLLVDKARENGFNVVPIPGVSAFTTLLSVAGVFGKAVLFEGFLSPKQGKRARRLIDLMRHDVAIVIYESPYRIVRLLETINEIDSKRRVIVGKELTKAHEDIVLGSAEELVKKFSSLEQVKGEFSVLILP